MSAFGETTHGRFCPAIAYSSSNAATTMSPSVVVVACRSRARETTRVVPAPPTVVPLPVAEKAPFRSSSSSSVISQRNYSCTRPSRGGHAAGSNGRCAHSIVGRCKRLVCRCKRGCRFVVVLMIALRLTRLSPNLNCLESVGRNGHDERRASCYGSYYYGGCC